MVHPGGRPRTNCPEKEELIDLGKDLVKWATEPTKELRCRFCQWYTLRGFIEKQWNKMREKPEFRWYYEMAKGALGQRLLDGSVNPSMAHRISWHYLPESARQEKAKIDYQEQARAQADIKTAQAINVITTNYSNAFDPCQKPKNDLPLKDGETDKSKD